MADILNLANCASKESQFNVGLPLCDLKKTKMKAVILLDKGVTFSGAEIASVAAFIAAVKTKTTADRGSRVYPIWDILNFEDSTGDPATGSVGNLSTATIITQDASPAFRFGYNGSEARHARMAAIAGSSLDIMFVDDQWAVYGTDRDGAFGGYSVLQGYADTSKFIVSDSVNQYSFRVTLGSITEYRDNSRYIVANAGLLAATGLINITMKQFSLASNVLKVQPISDGGTNVEPLHGAALAGLDFTATNLQTGASFTITSTADDGADKALAITLDSTAFAALGSGDQVQISGPSAADMAAAGVKPYEFIPFIVTKP